MNSWGPTSICVQVIDYAQFGACNRCLQIGSFSHLPECYQLLSQSGIQSKWIEFIEEPFHRLLEYWSTKTPLAELTNANLD
jgi:hypothetical protein